MARNKEKSIAEFPVKVGMASVLLGSLGVAILQIISNTIDFIQGLF